MRSRKQENIPTRHQFSKQIEKGLANFRVREELLLEDLHRRDKLEYEQNVNEQNVEA